jgi:hypothetical protein
MLIKYIYPVHLGVEKHFFVAKDKGEQIEKV